MKTGSLRAIAAVSSLALCVVSVGCVSTGGRSMTREEKVEHALTTGLGISGRMLVNDLGQAAPTRLKVDQARFHGANLVLVDNHDRLIALDRTSLFPQWTFAGIDGDLRYLPQSNALSVLGMTRDKLYQIDRRYGHEQGGAVHFDMTPSAAFVASSGTAFVPSWGGSRGQKTLRTLNLTTGLEGWGYRTAGDIRAALAIGGDAPREVIYFATDQGAVYAIPADAADGPAPAPTWSHQTHAGVSADLVVDGGHLFVAGLDSFLYCMDRITGGVQWAAPMTDPLTTAPAATAASVYQLDSRGLVCVDRATGTERWVRGDCVRFIVERQGRTICQGRDGSLIAVNGAGEEVGRTNAGRYHFPTNAHDDRIYAIARDGFIVTIEVGE